MSLRSIANAVEDNAGHERLSFRIQHLWSEPIVNPIDQKSYTLPLLNFRSPYSRNFHLSWLGFFVAFLSWFAFPPLIPEAIAPDLNLTSIEVANSNLVSLCATLLVRLFVGPAVDIIGPRRVMALLLVLGAIPSGLAGCVSSAGGLYTIRFFIGILGGTFVPCQAWTTAFFDKSIVGTANALSAGWGNAGGGATYAVMVALHARLRTIITAHTAWRVAFAIVPVPVLLIVACAILFLGTDHPDNVCIKRHTTAATELDKEKAISLDTSQVQISVTEVNEARRAAFKILLSPHTWLTSLAYMSTFGFELVVDSTLASTLLDVRTSLGQLDAGYLASLYGLMNIFTRPLGGYVADHLYARFGIKAKKYLCLVLGILQGVFTIAFGRYLQSSNPSLGVVMLFVVLMAFMSEMANGATFALIPHCDPFHNGSKTGIAGAFGNLGGICYALIFRFQPARGAAWVGSGIFALTINALLLSCPSPAA